jgi:signal transduction histidine kinase
MSLRVRPQHGFLALGVAGASLGIQHLLFEGDGLGTVIESFIILSIAGLLFYTAAELPSRDITDANLWRALTLSIATAISFGALAGSIWVTWWVEGRTAELSFLLSFASNLGALVGARASLYAAEAEERLAEAEELSKLLSINQRVLRHNIRNELSVALGYLDTIERGEHADEITETTQIIRTHLEALLEASDRTRRIVGIWKTDDVHEFDLTTLIRDQVADAVRETPSAAISTELPASCRVHAHASLPLAFEEAIKNAIQHNAADVTVGVRVQRVDDETVCVRVTDTGCGIPESEREILESPGETPLEHTEGVGLWMIYWTVNRSGGTVEFVDNEPRGTTIRMELPTDGPTAPVQVR